MIAIAFADLANGAHFTMAAESEKVFVKTGQYLYHPLKGLGDGVVGNPMTRIVYVKAA